MLKLISHYGRVYVIESEAAAKAVAKRISGDPKLDYFKRLALEALGIAEKREEKVDAKSIAKAFFASIGIAKARAMPVGTVVDRLDGKYVKIAPGKWRRKYEGHSRGAKAAIASIRRKVDAAGSSEEVLGIVMENKARFQDAEGRPYEWVRELASYCNRRKHALKRNVDDGEKSAEYKRAREESAKKHRVAREKVEGVSYTNAMRKALKEKLSPQFGMHKNEETGIEANLSNKSVNKMSSDKAIQKSKDNGFSVEEHFEVAEHIVELYEKASLVEAAPDKKGDPNILSIKRFDAPYVFKDGKKATAHITVKESIQSGHKIYSVEVMDIEQASQKDQPVSAVQGDKTPVAGSTSTLSHLSPFDKIKAKYSTAKKVVGKEGKIHVGDKKVYGTWKVVEADVPTASHDEDTFNSTPGFPTNKQGKNINDRDYSKDDAAKENVIRVAHSFDERALNLESPVVVSKDGIVISGNNRTMSSKIAARKGTDGEYLEELKDRVNAVGIKSEKLKGFKHPRLIFELKDDVEYTTTLFSKFNQSDMKAMNPVERAVSNSKVFLENPDVLHSISNSVAGYDSMAEFFANRDDCNDVFNTLIDAGIVTRQELPQYFNEGITDAGRDFLANIMVGAVVNEDNIRLMNLEGGKDIRNKLAKAMVSLVMSEAKEGYSIKDELNNGVALALRLSVDRHIETVLRAENENRKAKKRPLMTMDEMVERLTKDYYSGDMYTEQTGETPLGTDRLTVEFAKKIVGMKPREFCEFMNSLGLALREAASGQMDLFTEKVETKEDVLRRYFPDAFKVAKAIAAFLKALALRTILKSNPNRDERGRFANGIPSLKNNIERILNGTSEEKERLKGKYFKVADTGKLLKEYGLTGDVITIKYGVISHHKGKDTDHNLTAKEWKMVCDKINTPNFIAERDGRACVFLDGIREKDVLVGLEVKSTGRYTQVNAVKTVFAKDIDRSKDKVLYERSARLESSGGQNRSISSGHSEHSTTPTPTLSSGSVKKAVAVFLKLLRNVA